MERVLNEVNLEGFERYLKEEEKSKHTIEKYMRDVKGFFCFVGKQVVTKEVAVRYKKKLMEDGYAVRSINSMLASINSLFSFLEWGECKVKSMKLQHQVYSKEEKELTKDEYVRLVNAAKKQPRLQMVLQTICGTGIRVSELVYFTVEAVKKGEVTVSCKSKIRTILIPGKLRKMLMEYAKQNRIVSGILFRTQNGQPLNRSNIWREMKRLCKLAGVEEAKVFPHNLRKLFARTFYQLERDIAKLADVLGHSSIDTTRIYIMTTGREHRRLIEKMGLVVWEET